jgi:broad specificity phosphatase PhoE
MRRDVPAREWVLSEQGAARARQLAARLDLARAGTLYSSVEPKAMETASIVGETWGLPVEGIEGVHEHERHVEPVVTRDEFERRMRELFARPGDVVFGAESANAARRRFARAVMRLVARSRDDVAVVTHGTVLALFVADATGTDAFALWRRLDMPQAITLSVPELTLDGTTSVDA